MKKLELIADEYVKSDILIIGSEGAGARAAIQAGEKNLRIVMTTKGSDIGRSGATVTANSSTVAIDSRGAREQLDLPGDPNDDPCLFFEDIVKDGKYVNDQEQVEVLVKEAPLRAKELRDWGYRWEKILGPSPGHRFPRGCSGFPSTGPAMLQTMKKVLKTKPNVRLIPDVLILDLLVEEGHVCGAAGLDLKTGKFVVFEAKGVILATGGGQNVYPYVSGPHDLTGDGQAMAYRAGAEMIDLEFIQFVPAALIWPPGWDFARHGPMPLLLDGKIEGPHFLNRRGERYLKKWDPERIEKTTRDIWAIAAATEIKEGRGSEHGGVYFSIKHMPDDIVDFYGKWGIWKNWKSTAGFDFKPLIEQMKRGIAVELGIYCHFFMGGVNIDKNGKTNLEGLYAAGECAGLVHGANRLSGVALSQILVQGMRAGEAAAENITVSEKRSLRINLDILSRLKDATYRPLNNTQGIDSRNFRKEIQQVASEKVFVIRDEANLRAAIKKIGEKRLDLSKIQVSSKYKRYNLEWIEAIQAANLIDVLEMIARSALMRTESRGAHYRNDFPFTDNDNWLKNIILIRKGETMHLYTRPVRVISITPPRGTVPYPTPWQA